MKTLLSRENLKVNSFQYIVLFNNILKSVIQLYDVFNFSLTGKKNLSGITVKKILYHQNKKPLHCHFFLKVFMLVKSL